MELYIIADKNLFSAQQLTELWYIYQIFFVEEGRNLLEANFTLSDKEKVIAIDPDFCDWQFPKEILEKTSNIKALCLWTTTASYIDTEYCREHNIAIYNLPNYSTQSVAEYLIFFAFCLAKKLPLQLKNKGKEDYSDSFLTQNIHEKHIGIVWLGNIWSAVAYSMKGFGNRVSYWSKNTRNADFSYRELSDIFKQCDIIFITLATNSETKQLITDDMLHSMKTNASIISVAGKANLNHDLLVEKCWKNEIFGYALEETNKTVFDYEGNIMITSEYARFTDTAIKKRIEIRTQKIIEAKQHFMQMQK